MALAFPLSLADLFDLLPIGSCTPPKLSATLQQNRTRGGDVLTAGGGSRLWRGTVNIARLYHRQADALLALLSVVEDEGGSFMFRHPAFIGPADDPSGAKLGTLAPKIMNVATNSRDLRISGLPSGYLLSRGDFLSFTYGTNPVRHALHQVVSANVAAGAGGQALVEVTPHIRPGFTVGADVRLVRPQAKAVIIPGTFAPGTSAGVFTTGISFDFTQTLG